MSYEPSGVVFTTTNGGVTWDAHSIKPAFHGYDMPENPYPPVPFSAPTPTTWFALTPYFLIETT